MLRSEQIIQCLKTLIYQGFIAKLVAQLRVLGKSMINKPCLCFHPDVHFVERWASRKEAKTQNLSWKN